MKGLKEGLSMEKWLQSHLTRRVLWTLFFLFIYVLGSQLVLPFVDVASPEFFRKSQNLSFSVALMGGNLKTFSLFSVGLSPWMSSMIIWQMFSFSKKLGLRNLPIEVQDRRRMYVTLVIALIQSLAVAVELPVKSGIPEILVILTNTLILIAGTFFLIWLSDLNSLMGIGGSVVILMAGMVMNIPAQVLGRIEELQISWMFISLLLFLGLVFLYISVIVFKARYRIPINKVNIHNRFNQYSYLDIMLNPAGGMPFMYAMSLVMIPQYFLMLLQVIFPKSLWISEWIQSLSIGRPNWLLSYFLTLFILSLAFAFVNYSGEQIAERMKKSGEYIYGVYPGEETAHYINKIVMRFAIVGALYTIVMAGGPMLVVLIDFDYLQLSMIPGTFLIFSGMVFTIQEEVNAITLNESYTTLFN